jgi:hypothetical protein
MEHTALPSHGFKPIELPVVLATGGTVSTRTLDLWPVRAASQPHAGGGTLAPAFLYAHEGWITTRVPK